MMKCEKCGGQIDTADNVTGEGTFTHACCASSRPSDIKKSEEAVGILRKIFKDSGYHAYFENVFVDLEEKNFHIYSNKGEEKE